jgi:hypothetical protein
MSQNIYRDINVYVFATLSDTITVTLTLLWTVPTEDILSSEGSKTMFI